MTTESDSFHKALGKLRELLKVPQSSTRKRCHKAAAPLRLVHRKMATGVGTTHSVSLLPSSSSYSSIPQTDSQYHQVNRERLDVPSVPMMESTMTQHQEPGPAASSSSSSSPPTSARTTRADDEIATRLGMSPVNLTDDDDVVHTRTGMSDSTHVVVIRDEQHQPTTLPTTTGHTSTTGKQPESLVSPPPQVSSPSTTSRMIQSSWLKTRLQEVEEELSRERIQRISLEKASDEWTTNRKALLTSLNDVVTSKVSLEEQIDFLQNQSNKKEKEWEQQNVEFQNKIRDMENQLNYAHTAQQLAESQRVAAEEAAAGSEKANLRYIDELREENNSLKGIQDSLNSDLEASKKEVEKLGTEILDKEKLWNDQQQQTNEKTQESIDQFKKELANAEKLFAQKDRLIELLEARLETAVNANEELEKENEQLARECQDAHDNRDEDEGDEEEDGSNVTGDNDDHNKLKADIHDEEHDDEYYSDETDEYDDPCDNEQGPDHKRARVMVANQHENSNRMYSANAMNERDEDVASVEDNNDDDDDVDRNDDENEVVCIDDDDDKEENEI